MQPTAITGWAVGMISGTIMAASQHFTAIFPLQLWGGRVIPGYTAFYACIANILVTVILTVVFGVLGVSSGADHTTPADYVGEH